MTTKEENDLIGEFVEALSSSVYQRGYKNGIADGNINDGTFAKKIEEAYKNGLNDAWGCARKIMLNKVNGGLPTEEHSKIFGYVATFEVLKNYTASEAIAKIKEYEEKDKHKCKECKWDEFRDAQSPVGTPCDSCFEGKNFSPKVARCCSILEDECPYDVKCEECEIHWSIERAREKLKEGK